MDDIRNALQFARENKLRVSIAGVRHRMGGQAFYKNNLVLDMRGFNQIRLNEAQKTITVQSGATWHDIQSFLHSRYAVKAMQSTDIFTVGGSISVNAHGMDHRAGSVGSSIQSMRVMLADGSWLPSHFMLFLTASLGGMPDLHADPVERVIAGGAAGDHGEPHTEAGITEIGAGPRSSPCVRHAAQGVDGFICGKRS